MSRFLDFVSAGARACLAAIGSLLLWTLWLALALLLVLQLYILTANELAIPDFALRQIESRLAASGLRASFGRTSFDPSGRVLIEQVRLSLPAFSEPIATARTAFVHLNPWMLIVGRFEPTEIHVTDASMAVPAMLSPTGRPEEIVRNLDLSIEPRSRSVTVRQLSARVAGVVVSARGTLPVIAREKPASDALAEFFARRFPSLCRQVIAASEQLAHVENPAIDLELAPSESGAATIRITVLARGLNLDQPLNVRATNVQATTRLLLFGDTPATSLELAADELDVPGKALVRGLHALVAGRLRMEGLQFDVREATVTADRLDAADVAVHALSAQVFPRPLPRLEANVVARVIDAPLAVRAEADLGARSAVARFAGAVSPGILDTLSRRFHVDVRKYYDFDSLTAERGEVRFGPEWAFEKLTARVRVPRMNSYGVIMEDGRATVELDPRRFYSPDAFARVGENFARGTYEHDLKTHEFRFLLDGRLRPMDISEWFHEWWPDFFRQLEFPVAPPSASVDVRGIWHEGNAANVFVFADAQKPIIRGTAFDHVRTRLFIRPAFVDGLELLAERDAGAARGRFTYTAEPENHVWHTLELAFDSTLELKTIGQLLGPNGAKSLAAFHVEAAPALKVDGTLNGPAAPGGEHEKLRIEARTRGEFRFHDFPLQDVSFVTTLDGDDLVLDDMQAKFGGGVARGHARVWGRGAERRLGFDYSLRDASLGQVASALSEFFAAQKGQPPTPPTKFVKEKANVRFDFAASAEGRYSEAFSYHGDGSAVLRGAEIGEVPLLGMLSELLKFTALRFTEARTNFKIDGANLVFPQVTLRGANSAIDAHGTYHLDRRELDFNAKIFPFQESESIIKSVVGAVLTPLSNVFELKLTGTLDKPEWAFAKGPTNLLRSLAPGEEAAKAEAAAAADPKSADPKAPAQIPPPPP
jgi:hypothetical protein